MKQFKMFFIDDNEVNHLIIKSYCNELNIPIKFFTDGQSALDLVEYENPDIIITRHVMKKMNGLEFICKLREINRGTPVILITSTEEEDIKMEALEAGATEFLVSPVHKLEFITRIKNLIDLRRYQKLVENKVLLLESEIEKATETILKREKETLMVLVNTAKKKDSDTGNHVVRVANYARLLGKKLGISEKEQEEIFYAAQLHDLGKIGIPDSILNKRGKLTFDEFEIMKNHSMFGYEILKHRDSEYLRKGSIIAISHHERYDGLGYPRGLSGENIPIEGRIVAIADVFDALLMKRSYKDEWSMEDALDYIKKSSGGQFDPKLVDIFLNSIEEIEAISKEFKD